MFRYNNLRGPLKEKGDADEATLILSVYVIRIYFIGAHREINDWYTDGLESEW